MKHLLITTIAAVLLGGCREPEQSVALTEAKPSEPVAEVQAQPSPPPPVVEKRVEPLAEAVEQELPTPKAPDISIHEAAEAGNMVVIKKHLVAGADVNTKLKGRTLLHAAAGKGRKEIVELLIDNDANVNVKDAVSGTPLHEAALRGDKEVVELLITKGADVNAKDLYGWTPLYKATHKGHKEVVELLISKGSDVNAKNKDGDTPLDATQKALFQFDTSKVEAAKKEIADLLRKHGAKTAKELKVEKKKK